MSNTTTDLPAFPIHGPLFATGLTKRELFAAMAMHGFITSTRSRWAGYTIAEIAADATAMADALLAELAKPKEEK